MNKTTMTETYHILSDTHYEHLKQPLNRIAGPRKPPSASHGWDLQASTHGKSHHQQHPVRRRTSHKLPPSRPRQSMPVLNLCIAIVILLSCCCSLTTAAATPIPTPDIPKKITDPLAEASEELRLALAHLAESGTIVVDTRPQPPLPVEKEGLLRRDSNNSSSSATQSSSSSTVATSVTTSSGSAASGTASPSPLPSPFDSSLGNNYTSQSCPDFITSFLHNATFQACLPLSLLLESSQSFFQAEKSIVRITQTLDATCAANVTACDALMQSLANNLTSSANCGADYTAQNPTVIQAHTGLIAYKPLYTASCLKNPSTSSYCFADAVTNASSPTDSYVYYLALNTSLPGGSQPTCNACLQNTMAVFDAAAANRSQPVASTYIAAAQQINVNCGPGFVNASIPAAASFGIPSSFAPNPIMGLTTLLACALALLL